MNRKIKPHKMGERDQLVIKHRKYPQNTVLTLYGDRWQ